MEVPPLYETRNSSSCSPARKVGRPALRPVLFHCDSAEAKEGEKGAPHKVEWRHSDVFHNK